MAKYSTGSSGAGGGTTCELCGSESDRLSTATIAGATLEVCRDCAPHDDAGKRKSTGSQPQGEGSGPLDERERKRRAVQNAAKASPAWDGDSKRWEREGTNYDDDPLPYLVANYGEKLQRSRQEAGLTHQELAEALDVQEADVIAIEQGRATQAGIGGGLIAAIEDELDVSLAE